MISIAMAAYNGAKYISEQIDSILNQTIQDFELIVCDDCSTDSTWKILEDYSVKDNRIKLYRNPVNIGFKDNFEKVIRECTGEYIALCDQDDIWFPNHLSVLLDAMDGTTQIVCGESIFVNESGEDMGCKYSYLFGMDYKPSDNMDIARHIFLNIGSVQGTAMLIKKELFNTALPIPPETTYHDCWFAAIACFTGGFKFVDTPVLMYRRHSGEVTSGIRRQGPLRAFIGRTLTNHTGFDRIPFVKEIKMRVPFLTKEQRILLDLFEKLLLRRNTLVGRLMNVPYMIIHFKSIFGFDGKHLL